MGCLLQPEWEPGFALTEGPDGEYWGLLFKNVSALPACELWSSFLPFFADGSSGFLNLATPDSFLRLLRSGFALVLQVHRKIREDSDMAQDSLQCLAQLASMHGPIFPDESARVSYLAHLVEGLLSMING